MDRIRVLINIKIDEGGKKYIRINDNGLGMNRDDLLLSIERHATSKILSEEDLFSIKTLGFRGEALPSIASVSRMTITSRLKDDLVAHRLVINGGQLKSIDEAGSPVGTSVEVRDLFFNVPARRKFLRAVKTETNHIVDALSRIVLPYSNIQLRLDSPGRTLLNLPSSENELNRLSRLFGRDVASSMIEAFLETDGLSV
ncbi:MAG: DNA mismatch repair protein MutL, partial [Deltaproteobacteria bacterium]|nr:DNA mismatch repair protein MutL [Deltaproteobacteria bacterium]